MFETTNNEKGLGLKYFLKLERKIISLSSLLDGSQKIWDKILVIQRRQNKLIKSVQECCVLTIEDEE